MRKMLPMFLFLLTAATSAAESNLLYTISCEFSYDQVGESMKKFNGRYGEDAFVWTIDLTQKKFYSWGSHELLPIARLTDSEICLKYEQIESIGHESACINRFDGRYLGFLGIMGLQRMGGCKKTVFRSIPSNKF